MRINVVDVVSPTNEIYNYQNSKQQIINPNMLNGGEHDDPSEFSNCWNRKVRSNMH